MCVRRLQTISLIHRSDPQCPHSRRWTAIPCYHQTWSMSTKAPMPGDICGLPSSRLGCIRKRKSLFIILYQFWHRFPCTSLYSSPSICSTTDPYPCLFVGCNEQCTTEPSYVNPQSLPQPQSSSSGHIIPLPHITHATCLSLASLHTLPTSLRFKPRSLPTLH